MKLQKHYFSRENYDTMLHFGWEEENKFGISLGLASLSSFSLATRTQASLVLARSCVSCAHFSACFASPEDSWINQALRIGAPRKIANKFNFVESPKGLQAALLGEAKASVVATDAHPASALSKENASLFYTFAR